MERIYSDTYKQLTAKYDATFDLISIEQSALMSNGSKFNTGRLSLSIQELKTLVKYAQKKGIDLHG